MDATNGAGVEGQLVFASGITAGDCTTAATASVPVGTWIVGQMISNSTTTAATATILVRPGFRVATSQTLLNAALFSDVAAASAVRGDGLFAIGLTPTWQRVMHPATTGGYFKWNGTDMVASSNAASGTGACSAGQYAKTLNLDAPPTCSAVTADQIAPAAAPATIANANNSIAWNWAQTTATQTGLAIGETSAATNGAGSQYLMSVSTLSGSTSTPLEIANSLTGSQILPSVDILPTWNTTGVATGIHENITNTASGAGSKLIDLQVGGNSVFKVDHLGTANIETLTLGNTTAGVNAAGRITLAGSNTGVGGCTLSTNAGGTNLTSSCTAVFLSAAQIGTTVTKYNGITAVDNGVPSEYGGDFKTLQGGALSGSSLYSVPAAANGMYRVCYVASVTRGATTSSTLGPFTITYTDQDDSVSKTMPGQATTGVNQNTVNTAALGTISGCYVANAKASTAITYSMGYTSMGATTMQYNNHVKLEAL